MQTKNKTYSILVKLALVITISFFSNFTNAQETDSVRIAINNILAPLNKTLIPTGILAENSCPLLDLSVYNGQLSADNTIDFSQWRLLYNQALSGVNAANILSLAKTTKAIEFHSSATRQSESGMDFINHEMNESLRTVISDEKSVQDMVKELKKL